MERSSNKLANYVTLVTAQLIIIASHMAGLGLPDIEAWYIIETIAEKNNVGYKQFGIAVTYPATTGWLLGNIFWQSDLSITIWITISTLHEAADDGQQPAEASGVGRSWVQSMFSRDITSRTNSFSRVRKWTSDSSSAANESVKNSATPRKPDLPPAGQRKVQSSVRIIRGHTGAITALHCVTQREVWDLVGDREDAGLFISGSTDCTVKVWDPSLRGSELRATLKGHTRPIRAINSDRGKVVSGSDDQSVIVWDKQTFQILEELKGHDAQVSSVKMLSGERVLTASHDGTVKMWDVRTDTCVATVGRCLGAVLCMEYDDSTGILAAAGRDAVANVWDIRASRQVHKLLGHTKWIRSIRMVKDTILTGSDDWTARMWSASRGTCSADGLIRFWEKEEGGIRCVKNVTIHSAPILSINAGEHWLGIGAGDNSMSLFHRPQERLGSFSSTGSKSAGWQLYRTPQRTVAMVRCVASDLDRKRICSGGRNGLLRIWEATINI
ncbi:U-box domain-containing protein 72 [Acorus calamus]|uniref:U-box domain-containing protein 72 n=1 Tax=Acorus calamus TaxID=4465 RepID=A0AAV9E426_ACOCL|nr:U-box domain-containing protein 72 [Acorus calamus]